MTEADFREIHAAWKKKKLSGVIFSRTMIAVPVSIFVVILVLVLVNLGFYYGLGIVFGGFLLFFVASSALPLTDSGADASSSLTEEASFKFFDANPRFLGYLEVLREAGEIRTISRYEKLQLLGREVTAARMGTAEEETRDNSEYWNSMKMKMEYEANKRKQEEEYSRKYMGLFVKGAGNEC